MPNSSDRERLLKLIDGSAPHATPAQAPGPALAAGGPAGAAMPSSAAPLIRPQVVFQLKERAARVYDRVRAAVASPEADHRFPLATATLVLMAALSLFWGLDRWKMWGATREVAVVDEAQALTIREKLGLKLVGIDWSEVPVALVEDTASGKTHFLRQGDSVNGARVQLIFKDKVIFQTKLGRIALR